MIRFAAIALTLLLAACGDAPPSPFVGDPAAPSLDRAPEKTTGTAAVLPEGPFCKPDAAGRYKAPKDVIQKSGKNGENFFAEGGGCIAASLVDIWESAQKDSVARWRESDLVSFKKMSDPRVDLYFESHHEAGPSFPFVGRTNWDMGWFQSVTEGTAADPLYLVVKYRKIRGTSHIVFWEGSFELKALGSAMTSIVLRNELRGTQIDQRKANTAVTDLFKRLKDALPAR